MQGWRETLSSGGKHCPLWGVGESCALTKPHRLQKEEVLGSEIAARNRKSLATFHRTLKSQCSIAFSCLGTLTLQSLLFSISLLFFRFSLLFGGVFPFFSKEVRGSAKRKPLLFSGFPLLFSKKQGLEGQGNLCYFWGPRWASQSQIAKIAAISVREGPGTPGRCPGKNGLCVPRGPQD